MGLYDRDYSREDQSWNPVTPWSRLNSGPSMTIMIIIANVAVFVLDIIVSGSNPTTSVMADWFGVAPDAILKPWTWYQLLTYGFVHSLFDIRHILFNMLGLFIFGRTVEARLGRNEFLRFYLIAIIVGGLASTLRWTGYAFMTGLSPESVSPGTVGASGAVMAVTVLFAFMEPNAVIYVMAIYPVKAWLLAVVYVAMNVVGLIGVTDNVAYDVHLAGAGFAALYFKRRWDFSRLDWSAWTDSLRRLTRRSPRLRIHDPQRKWAQEEVEADRILDKIQASGMDSLTKAERRMLEKYSRRKREANKR